MDNYLDGFREMVTEVHNHPKTIVLEYKEYEPATPKLIDTVELQIGFKIPTSIRNFYSQTNGLVFKWIHTDDELFNKEEHIKCDIDLGFSKRKRNAPGYGPDGEKISGCVNIMGIEDVFMEECSDFEWLYDKTRTYYKPLYLFDVFSYIHGAAIHFPKNHESANVIFDFDHYAGFDDNHHMTFEDYMAFLIKSKCLKRGRALTFDGNDFNGFNLDRWDENYALREC